MLWELYPSYAISSEHIVDRQWRFLCCHVTTLHSFSSPPPPLELHLRAKSYQSFTYFSFLQTSLRTEKQQRPDNKDSHTRERFGVNTVWVDNPRCNDCKTSWKTHIVEAKEKRIDQVTRTPIFTNKRGVPSKCSIEVLR